MAFSLVSGFGDFAVFDSKDGWEKFVLSYLDSFFHSYSNVFYMAFDIKLITGRYIDEFYFVYYGTVHTRNGFSPCGSIDAAVSITFPIEVLWVGIWYMLNVWYMMVCQLCQLSFIPCIFAFTPSRERIRSVGGDLRRTP